MKTVGGIVFPSHPLAATAAELEGLIGFSRDIKASRAKARALLKEAGAEGIEFDFATNPEVIYWPFNNEYWEDELGYYERVEPGDCKE